jgi:hypothetical protein
MTTTTSRRSRWRWFALPGCLVADALLLWLVIAVDNPDPTVATKGQCTISVVPSYWVFLAFWLFALAAAGTAAVAVLSTRWIFARRRAVALRVATVVVAAGITGASLLAAVVVPVNLHEDSIPRTLACHGGY